ncbi:GGDEF domain-containing response regulator [Sutcliffiella deserti]|uniref:GGDEF domain-containing response regulator n=1 Tax=Sutcliffiella deserti TaxID=2875501 RepID=UPI001CC0B7D9|nr:diguanylate cyclase [Sutcliffiella deserti]
MDKYKNKLLLNIKEQFNTWLEEEGQIPFEEVYRFVHSLAGTAHTLGITELGDIASTLYEKIKKMEKTDWSKKEIQVFFIDIIQYCYRDEWEDNTENLEFSPEDGQSIILILDDDTSMLIFLKEMLEREGFQVLVASSVQKAISIFYEVKPDCFILGVHMQREEGLEVLEFLSENLHQLFIPTIMMSLADTKAIRIKSYQLGADDFIKKPFDIEEFIVRVKRQLERKKQIENVLLLDELTQVYNRRFFRKSFTQQMGEIGRSGEVFCIAMLDLDFFKKVNDTYGHVIGDQVLKGFATFMKNNLRSGDVFARYGGEEFAVILPKTDRAQSVTLLNRILKGFSSMVFNVESEEFSCTFSGGVVEVSEDTFPLEYWLEKADQALYEAKDKGRARVVEASLNLTSQKKLLKLAIVDDDPIIRTMLQEVLSKLPNANILIEVKTFPDGLSFLQSEWLKQDGPILVVLDGMMPKMDGLEVLQRLRKNKRYDQVKVIMLTSRKSEQDIQKALEFGADDYITKPFKLLELEARVRHLMKRVK